MENPIIQENQNLSVIIAESGLHEEMDSLTGEITIAANDSIALADKVDALASVIASFEQKKAYAKERKDRWAQEQKVHENTIERLKWWVKTNMLMNELKKLEGSEHKFTLASRPAKLVVDETILSNDYFKEEVIFVLNKDKIKSELEEGATIQGASLEPVNALTIR